MAFISIATVYSFNTTIYHRKHKRLHKRNLEGYH